MKKTYLFKRSNKKKYSNIISFTFILELLEIIKKCLLHPLSELGGILSMTSPDIPVGRRTASETTAAARPLMMVLPSLGAVELGVACLPDTGQHYRAGLQVFT